MKNYWLDRAEKKKLASGHVKITGNIPQAFLDALKRVRAQRKKDG